MVLDMDMALLFVSLGVFGYLLYTLVKPEDF